MERSENLVERSENLVEMSENLVEMSEKNFQDTTEKVSYPGILSIGGLYFNIILDFFFH